MNWWTRPLNTESQYYAAYDVFTLRKILNHLRENLPTNLTKVVNKRLQYQNPLSTEYLLQWVNGNDVFTTPHHKEDEDHNYEDHKDDKDHNIEN